MEIQVSDEMAKVFLSAVKHAIRTGQRFSEGQGEFSIDLPQAEEFLEHLLSVPRSTEERDFDPEA
jgi:hypothetical protein